MVHIRFPATFGQGQCSVDQSILWHTRHSENEIAQILMRDVAAESGVDAPTSALALVHASDAHPALQNAALRLALSPELLPRLAVPPAEPVRCACMHLPLQLFSGGIRVRASMQALDALCTFSRHAAKPQVSLTCVT